MNEHLFRGDRLEHERSRGEFFDAIAEGRRYGLTPEKSIELWQRVRREATNHDGVCNESLARERFAQMAEQLNAAPGKRTQVEVASGAAPARSVFSTRVPGKTTQVLARASIHARVGVPGRTTLVASQGYSDVCTSEDSRGFFLRYISGGCAARSKLERAIASRDHYAAVVALLALQQNLRLARHHLANGLDHNEGLRSELAALEGSAEPLLAKLPNMSGRDRPWGLWGPESAEWRAVIGARAESPESTATEPAPAMSPHAERLQPASVDAADRDELLDASDAAGGLTALQLPKPSQTSGRTHRAEPRAPVRLPAPMLARMERAYGQPFGDVELHRDSAEVPAGQAAFTRERHIYLEPGAVDLETQRGAHIIAHELAHAVQQRGGGERDGTRQELEHEAARAAALAMQGQAARIALRAQPAIAYAFSEDQGAAHEDELGAGATTDAAKEATKPDAAHLRSPHSSADVNANHDHTANVSADAPEASHGDAGGDLEEVTSIIPGEGIPASSPGIAGGPAAKPARTPPRVVAAKPELALGQLRGVRPDKLAPVLGEVHAAASADVAQARAAQHASPPKQVSTGAAPSAKVTIPDGATGKSAAAKDATAKATATKNTTPTDAPPATGVAATAAKRAADHPVKGEVPGGEATKQATQGAAVQQQKAGSDVVTDVAHTIASWFGSWSSIRFWHTPRRRAPRRPSR